MNVTATLFGQMITLFVLVWFVKRYLWGPMTTMMEDRKKRIADGLAAAERGVHEQEIAEQRAKERLKEAKAQAAEILAQAQKRGGEIVEEAKGSARTEAERIKTAAQAEIEQEIVRAKEHLREQVVAIAVAGAEKILKSEVDASAHNKVFDELVAQI